MLSTKKATIRGPGEASEPGPSGGSPSPFPRGSDRSKAGPSSQEPVACRVVRSTYPGYGWAGATLTWADPGSGGASRRAARFRTCE